MSFAKRRRFLWALFLLGLALVVVAANATTLSRLKFEDLAMQASAIARVRCLRTTTHWKNHEIWTRTDFVVIEQAKGALSPTLQLEMPGGVLGHLHARVDEVPSFALDEESYLFLWAAPDGSYRILGWSQGAFRIRKDPVTGLETVTQDSASAPLFDPATRQFRHAGIRNLPVPVFQLKLKRVLEKQ